MASDQAAAILTAARLGEARLGTWSEVVDLQVGVWTLPAERMKSGREHRVPLSTRALEVLADAQKLDDGSGLLFPSPTGKALANMTTSKLLNGLGINATMHGFRTSFRSWCAENDESRELAEAALAHVVAGVEGAYMRSDLFERRRRLMQAWADYLGCSAAGWRAEQMQPVAAACAAADRPGTAVVYPTGRREKPACAIPWSSVEGWEVKGRLSIAGEPQRRQAALLSCTLDAANHPRIRPKGPPNLFRSGWGTDKRRTTIISRPWGVLQAQEMTDGIFAEREEMMRCEVCDGG